MIDPDPARPVLRLADVPPRADKPASVEDALARVTLAQHQADQANLRWIEALMDYQTMRAQAQPVPAQRRPTEKTDQQHLAKLRQLDAHTDRLEQLLGAGLRPVVFRVDGRVEPLGRPRTP